MTHALVYRRRAASWRRPVAWALVGASLILAARAVRLPLWRQAELLWVQHAAMPAGGSVGMYHRSDLKLADAPSVTFTAPVAPAAWRRYAAHVPAPVDQSGVLFAGTLVGPHGPRVVCISLTAGDACSLSPSFETIYPVRLRATVLSPATVAHRPAVRSTQTFDPAVGVGLTRASADDTIRAAVDTANPAACRISYTVRGERGYVRLQLTDADDVRCAGQNGPSLAGWYEQPPPIDDCDCPLFPCANRRPTPLPVANRRRRQHNPGRFVTGSTGRIGT